MRLFALFSFGFVFWLLVIIFQIYIQFKTYIKLVISSSVQRWLYDKRKVWWSPFGNVDSLRPDNLVKGLTLLPQKHSLNKVVAR